MAVITKVFSIANISIQASADTVEKRVGGLSGVRFVSVTLSSNTMSVEFDPDICDERTIIQTVRSCGYDAYTKEMPAVSEENPLASESLFSRELILSAVCALVLFILSFVPHTFWVSLAVSAIAFRLNFPMISESFAELIQKKLPGAASIRLSAYLITLVCGIIYGARGDRNGVMFLFSGCAIVLFSAFEKKLISLSRQSAAKSVSDIRQSLPKTASVYQNRRETIAAVNEITENQIIMIRPDDVIPADGRVVRGFATMNEAALTGMETPVEKSEGSYVYANSVCLSGSVEIRAEKTGSATAMMRLASLAEKTGYDDSFQSPFKSFGRYLMVYIAIAAVIAAGGWLFSGKDTVFALNVLIGVLCSASLRTLALSSENEVMNAAGEAMKNHVIFRSVEALEMVGKTDYAVIEQSGCISEDDLTVSDFICAEGMSQGRLEYIAYALESRSDRPFARAITRYLRSRRMDATDIAEFTRLSRKGRHAVQSLSSYRALTWEQVTQENIEHSEWEETVVSLRNEGKRVLIFTDNDQIIGVIAAVRPLIPGVGDTLKTLENAGVEVWMFSDAGEYETKSASEKLGLEHVLVQPEKAEKERLLAELDLEDTITAYISRSPEEVSQEDADITVAIGTGAETDIPEAGILLTRSRLSDFLYAFRLSKLLNERIARKQLAILIYHAAAVLLFGFILPAMFSFPLPPVIALICACAALCVVIKTKKEFR